MRKRIIALTLVAFALAGGTAVTASATPGPNGHNDYGLCNAWNHSGNNTGQAFQGLRDKAGDSDGNGTPNQDSDITAFCDGKTPGGR